MWMQINVMPWASLVVDAVLRHAQEAKQFGLVINVAKTKIMTVGNWKTTGKKKLD